MAENHVCLTDPAAMEMRITCPITATLTAVMELSGNRSMRDQVYCPLFLIALFFAQSSVPANPTQSDCNRVIMPHEPLTYKYRYLTLVLIELCPSGHPHAIYPRSLFGSYPHRYLLCFLQCHAKLHLYDLHKAHQAIYTTYREATRIHNDRGSMLGPILFLFYISDIFGAVSHAYYTRIRNNLPDRRQNISYDHTFLQSVDSFLTCEAEAALLSAQQPLIPFMNQVQINSEFDEALTSLRPIMHMFAESRYRIIDVHTAPSLTAIGLIEQRPRQMICMCTIRLKNVNIIGRLMVEHRGPHWMDLTQTESALDPKNPYLYLDCVPSYNVRILFWYSLRADKPLPQQGTGRMLLLILFAKPPIYYSAIRNYYYAL
ncbi:hypothetical protein CLF_111937 [Clonorchis sinensis]|uniref:Uncharacterized protein n=1 Tax=Clonorchis sinensis TaxID=79923 RepID=G7YVK2_CLOSI|nr:hypothetical protein CLF_111937 [Clonorchis sinensis]